MFDGYFKPSPNVDHLDLEVPTPVPATSTSSPSSTTVDQDALSTILSMQEDETKPAEVQEVVDVVTTAKLITEVVTAASETVTAASAIITTAEAQVHVAILTAAPSRRRK
nr:hypothetical protein [Tanacetum cinerariifolium]